MPSGRSPDQLVRDGLSDHKAGKIARAAKKYRAALKQFTNHPDANHLLGVLKLQSEGPEASLPYLKRAVDANPEAATYWFNLANARFRTADFVSAIKAFETARRLAPNTPEIELNYSSALQQADRPFDALAVLRDVYRAGRANSGIMHNYLSLLDRTNELDEAREVLANVPDRWTQRLDCGVLSAHLHRRLGQTDIGWGTLQKLKPADAPAPLAKEYHYEVARYHESAGRAAEAAAAYERAHALEHERARRLGISAERYLTRVDQAHRDLRAWRVAPGHGKVPASCDRSARLTFLIGFPRSGTTMLHRILATHPGVRVLDETGALILARQEALDALGWTPGDAARDPELAARVQDAYLKCAAEHADIGDTDQLIDKLPLNTVELPLIAAAFPRARILFAVRHPADVTLSCYMQQFQLNDAMAAFLDMDTTVDLYTRVVQLWLDARASLANRAWEQSYEALTNAPEPEVDALFNFLDLDVPANALRFYEKPGGYIHTPSYAQASQPIYRSAVGRWTRYAPVFAENWRPLAPFCEAFGYALPDAPPEG